MVAVAAYKATVKAGRLVLDEPTDLPDGEVVHLVAVGDALDDGDWDPSEDDMDDEERARLHEALDRGLADAKAGRTVDADEVIRSLRART